MENAARRSCFWVVLFLAVALSTGWAQSVNEEASENAEEQSPTPLVSDDAPLPPDDAEPQEQTEATYSTAGMGMPSAESPLRNYLLIGATANESVQYAPANNYSGPYATNSVTRLFGSLDYLRTKGRSQTAIDYRGGGFFFLNSDAADSNKQIQELTAQQSFLWHRTKLLFADSVSNFPGGDFGAAWFGGTSAYNLGLPPGTAIPNGPNTSNFFGFNTFGGLGQANYITNVAFAEVSQEVTPRSALAFTGGYAITDHIGNQDFIDSRQASGAVTYSYQLTQRSSIGGFYGYQYIRFIGGDDVMTNTVQGFFQHRISSRAGFAIGGGPQFIRFHGPVYFTIGSAVIPFTTTNHQTGASAYGSFNYNVRRSVMSFWYAHQVTNGSGIFEGASSDMAAFSYARPLTRAWSASFNAGFVRLSSLGNASTGLLGNSYNYAFVGAGVARKLGNRFSFYASYQFNDESFDTSSCATTSSCSGLVGRHVGVVGISWRSRPVVLGEGDISNAVGSQPLGTPATGVSGNPSAVP